MIKRQQNETQQDFVRAMQHQREIFQYHFARVWANRHKNANARQAVRANIAGQRGAIRAAAAA